MACSHMHSPLHKRMHTVEKGKERGINRFAHMQCLYGHMHYASIMGQYP